MAEVLLAAEVLQIGVLKQQGDDLFTLQVAGVFEQLQTERQANGVAGSSYSF
jgi:hypothetical protein